MKRILALMLALVMIVALCACGQQSAPASAPASSSGTESSASQAEAPAAQEKTAEPVVIKYGNTCTDSPEEPQIIGSKYFEKILEERSNGYYDVQLYPANQLGDSRTLSEGMQLGTVEMASIENGISSAFVPELAIWDVPFICRSEAHADAIAASELGQQEADLLAAQGFHVLAVEWGGIRSFINNKRPIIVPEDLKGMKLRCLTSQTMVDSINAFGANAIGMSFADVFSSLQQGVIDGHDTPWCFMVSGHFYETCKYFSNSEHFYNMRRVLMRESFFQEQSPEHQKLILECAAEANEVQSRAYYEANIKARNTLIEKGMQYDEIDRDAFVTFAQEKIWPILYERIGMGDAEAGKAKIEAFQAVPDDPESRALMDEIIAANAS